jgi:VWFA-related protein
VVRYLVSLSLALAGSVALVASQQTAAPPPQQPTFRSEANYIRVDAFVTADGIPVENLTPGEFEVLEDGVPQKVETFEYVRIQPAGPQATRIEPNYQEAGRQMAADPRSRVFVIFLDIDHVPVEGSHRLKTALAQMLSRMLAPEDLVGIITSRHSPTELMLGRKTGLIEEQLEKYWYWGRKDTVVYEPDEEMYMSCYAAYDGGEAVAEEMIDRRREKLTLDALRDLVVYLRGVREERKAVIAITAGWPLYRPNEALARPLQPKGGIGAPAMPSPPRVGIGEGGRMVLSDDQRQGSTRTLCERHRWELANIDDWDAFRNLTQDANRANVSFYPVDPRGLVVFDAPIGPRRPPGLAQDAAMLRTRQMTLRSMADETDGIAVVNTSDLTAGLRRVSADLSSYYLLGYYSSHTALDGKYHRITVRVKRPGTVVRARKGYRAATREEVARGETAAASSAPAATVNSAAAEALNRLALIRPDAALYVHATHQPGGLLWIAGEVPGTAARSAAWSSGVRVSIMAVDAEGNTVGVARKQIAPGERDFVASIPLDDPAKTPARVQVRAEPGGAPIGLEVAPRAGEPLLLRRTGSSPPRAAADFRFFRAEVLVYRWPITSADSVGQARVLDRNGKPIAVPTTSGEEQAEGGKWMAGSVTLAPLANGDYLLELGKKGSAGPVTILVPFRILR